MFSTRVIKWVFFTAILHEILCIREEYDEQTGIKILSMNVTNYPIQEADDIKAEFADFDAKTHMFIQSVEEGLIATMSNSSVFISELQKLIAKLPKGETTQVSFLGRVTCDCDGKRMSPCPAHCEYSCFGQFGSGEAWRFERDCRISSYLACQCYEGSSTNCDAGIKKCFVNTAGEIGDDDICSTYTVDEKRLVKSFKIAQDLLLEPIVAFTRKVENQSRFLKLAAVSLEYLTNVTMHRCSLTSTVPCDDTTLDLLKKPFMFYNELRNNLINEMIEKMDDMSQVNNDIERLKNRMFTHVQGILKGYACCLGPNNFTFENLDCPTSTSVVDPTPKSVTLVRPERAFCGSYKWVSSNGTIPENAVEAGFDSDKTVLYAGRARHPGFMLPAKIRSEPSGSPHAVVPFRGIELKINEFEFLVSCNVSWRSTNSETKIPEAALQVGSSLFGTPLYMGRAHHDGSLTPGMIISYGSLFIPYGNKVHEKTTYEILVLNVLRESTDAVDE